MKPPIHSQTNSAYQNRRVLITGGLGFIGSNLAIRLVEAGARVTVVDSMLSGCGANLFNIAPISSKIAVVRADIGQAEEFVTALAQAEIIFNLAGEISHSSSMEQPERDLDINVVAQLRFLLACREYCPGSRIVYAGTRQLYGKPLYLPVDERHPIQPVDFNGVHKFAATQYHLLLTNLGDLDSVVLRLSNVYGPRMALHLPQQGFLSVFLKRALEGQPITVFGDGTQLRDPVHVGDVVEAFLAAGVAPRLDSRVFNIGGPQAVCIGEIAATLARFGGGTVEQAPFPENLRNIDIGSYCSDISRAERELSWTPRIWFHEGIETTLQFYRRNREQYLTPAARGATA
jgi:UDP-glucose 4-epimerase